MFEAKPYTLPQYFELPIFLPPVLPFAAQTFSPFNLPKVREVPPMKRTTDQITQISSFEIPQLRDSKLPQGARSCRWSELEDSILKDHIVIHGTKAWAKAAAKINETLYGNQVIRQAEGEWSEEEDSRLLVYHIEYGNCWSKISELLTGRNENSVKNRFNWLIKRSKKYFKTSNPRILRKKLYAEWQDYKLTSNNSNVWAIIHEEVPK